ncbi:MAG: hypothetical protein AB8B62_01025 [Roseobacter sp.]
MARETRPIFLERRSYRRRRMMDALRLVALIGAILWMIPVIWPAGDIVGTEPVSMSRALYYVFGVWAGLILLAAYLAFNLRRPEDTETSETDEGDPRA